MHAHQLPSISHWLRISPGGHLRLNLSGPTLQVVSRLRPDQVKPSRFRSCSQHALRGETLTVSSSFNLALEQFFSTNKRELIFLRRCFFLTIFLYMVWVRNPNLFFFMWRSTSCLSITCWKDYLSPIELSWQFFKKKNWLDSHFYSFGLYVYTMPVPYCSKYCSFVVTFEVWVLQFFQYCFSYSGSLAFPHEF